MPELSNWLSRGPDGRILSEPNPRRRRYAKEREVPEPFALEDPMEALPPTAQRLLAAARRLLVRDGFTALTLSAIAEEAEESKASIGYHFGNKDGLVAALVDSLTHDANRALIQECSSLPAGPARMQALLEGESRIVADGSSFQAFFEVLPYALRDPSLRRRVAALYDGYRETVLRCISDTDPASGPELRSFCALMIAIVDGLAIQYCLDPEGADAASVIRQWGRLVRLPVVNAEPEVPRALA
ncbi:MAG: TetR/AcrR family transcriptional regulator [Acidimicrobiales bacterium]